MSLKYLLYGMGVTTAIMIGVILFMLAFAKWPGTMGVLTLIVSYGAVSYYIGKWRMETKRYY